MLLLQYNVINLSNWFYIVLLTLIPTSLPQVVCLKFAVMGGSSAESKDERGSAHLLASAAFAGSAESTGLRMVRYLESLGATIDSYADKEKVSELYHLQPQTQLADKEYIPILPNR